MRFSLLLMLLFISGAVRATSYYVDVKGNNSNSGTSTDAPFQTIPQAVSKAAPGDTIFIRGGVHTYSSTVNLSKSGTASTFYYLLAYPGERPVLDFSKQAFGSRAISLTGSYWYIKGIDVRYAGDNGLNISGGANNNVIEFCAFYENKDSGVQLGGGAHDNTFINCDSYYNADPTDYGDADGFAPKMDVGTNNRFVGCRSWGNCDDGWDGYMRGNTNVTTILENCWTWGNGWLKDGTNPGSQANGNGFKMGGSDDKTLEHNFILKNCVAFDNKVKGFDQNNNKGSMMLYNCTAYRNGGNNYSISQALAAGKVLEVKNCIAVDNKVSLGSFAVQATNSWMVQFEVTENDFLSMDTTGVSGPRKSDGSLPDVAFMKLAMGSDLIDSGTDLGFTFKGPAPDLGAFESDYTTGTILHERNKFKMWFKGDQLQFQYSERNVGKGMLVLYTLSGSTIVQQEFSAVERSVSCGKLVPGVYLAELRIGNRNYTTKVVKQ